MPDPQQRRKLSNVRLTREFHFRYMGLWILITICLVVTVNVLLLMLMDERSRRANDAVANLLGESLGVGPVFTGFLAVEVILFALVIVWLAMLTAHRIAGPYIRLKKACRQVRDGDLKYRLHFRNYDNLEELEKLFNEMMETIESRTGGKKEPEKETR